MGPSVREVNLGRGNSKTFQYREFYFNDHFLPSYSITGPLTEIIGQVGTIADLMTIRSSGDSCSAVLLGRQRLRIIKLQACTIA